MSNNTIIMLKKLRYTDIKTNRKLFAAERKVVDDAETAAKDAIVERYKPLLEMAEKENDKTGNK